MTTIARTLNPFLELARRRSLPLEDERSLDPLIEKIGGARVVLIGEASHGTHEYYVWRAKLTRRLIEEKGFSFVAVEGDWPDCYRLNRYAKRRPGCGSSVLEVLKEFRRWPTWMWSNWEVAAFGEWLSDFNDRRKRSVGFYGLDVYSLWESLEEILAFLRKVDPLALQKAKEAAACFEPYRHGEGQAYAWATHWVPETCEAEVVSLLAAIRRRSAQYDHDSEDAFSAEQNASVAVNAERYYRTMIRGGPDSWNLRDRHMVETLDRLMRFHGSTAKAVVWEHNTHVGDARATDMTAEGMINVGQLVRESYGPSETFLIGFGSHHGTVIAGKEWGTPLETMKVPPAPARTWEGLFHSFGPENKLLLLEDFRRDPALDLSMGHRAIGVVYDPDFESFGNYVPTILPKRYDAFLFLDRTRALHPIELEADPDQMPETYPFGF